MCNLELKKKTNPLWTEKHLENVRLSSFKEAYGFEFTEEQINEQRTKIRNGSSERRISEDMECYEIWDDNIYIGDISVNLSFENPEPEIDIIIFAEYVGRGYAKKAIERFIDFEGKDFNIIRCTVRHENPNLSKVENIIENLGFKYSHSSEDVKVYTFFRYEN